MRIQISGGFLLLTAWFALANGWRVTLGLLLAAALHELGHLAALRLCRAPVYRLRIGVLGAVLEMDHSCLSYPQELLVTLAGPLANLAAALVLAALGIRKFAGVHLVLCACNLLPLRPLDGGMALYWLVQWLEGLERGAWVLRTVGCLTGAVAAAILGALMWASGGSLWLIPPLLGILMAFWKEFCENDELF